MVSEQTSPDTMWFKDKLSESLWACDNSDESHQNEKDLKAIQA